MWSEWHRTDFTEQLPSLANALHVEEERPESDHGYSIEKQGFKHLPAVQLDNVVEKRERIGRIVKLDDYPIINGKIMKEHDNYFTFHRKLKNGCSRNSLRSLGVDDSAVRLIDCHYNTKIHNHLDGGLNLHSKKLLLSNLKAYYQR